MGKPHLSRHYIASQARLLASVPFAPAGQPDDTGIATTHNILAFAGWNEDAQEYQVSLADVAVGYAGTDVIETSSLAPSFNVLASFQTSSAPTALTTARAHVDGLVALITATADGSLYRLRLQSPTIPGSDPSSIQLREEDFHENALEQWHCDLHSVGTCTSLAAPDFQGTTVLSVGSNGTICSIEMDDSSEPTVLFDSRGGMTFQQVRWSTPQAFVTSSLQGVIHAWDVRSCSRPSHSIAHSKPLLSLCGHPGQPHTLFAGDTAGNVLCFDLRKPNSNYGKKMTIQGAVTGIEFEKPSGRLLACSSHGVLAASLGDQLIPLYKEPEAGMQGLVASSTGASDQIFASTDDEVLLFLANTSDALLTGL